MAFYRGCAIFPPAGYKGCGIILPVFLPSKDSMTYILIQVKDRARDRNITRSLGNVAKDLLKTASQELHPETTHSKKAKSKKAKSKRHLGIMIALRGKRDKASVDVVYPDTANEKKPEPGDFHFNDLERVIVVAVGMDFNIYPGLLHPRDSVSYPGPSADVLMLLKRLLFCTSDVYTSGMSKYHGNLRLLPFFLKEQIQVAPEQ